MPLKRLQKKIGKETLWLYILALLKSKPCYAYEIRPLIGEKFNFRIGNVTAYVVLYKLERKGCVKARWEMRGRRHRKYYEITAKGRKTLDSGIEYLKELAEKLSAA